VVLSSVRVLGRLVTLLDESPHGGTAYWDVNAGLGVGLIARGGSAWANVTGATHPAVVLSGETRTHLAGAATIRVGVEDFVSWATFNRGRGGESAQRVQHDLVITVALQIRVPS
jgi:hypothetical protein